MKVPADRVLQKNKIVNWRYAFQLLARMTFVVVMLTHLCSHALAYDVCIKNAQSISTAEIESEVRYFTKKVTYEVFNGIDFCNKFNDECRIFAPDKQKKNYRNKKTTICEVSLRLPPRAGSASFAVKVHSFDQAIHSTSNVFLEKMLKTIVMTI